MFQAMSSDAEAQNLKNNTVILMSHLGAHLVVSGVFAILKGQTGETDLELTKKKHTYSLQKKPL